MVRVAGRVVGIIGAAGFIAVVALLPYEGSGAVGRTLWQLTTREPAIVTAAAAVVLVLTVAAFASTSVVLTVLPACLSFYLCGQWFYDGSPNYTGLGVGFTLATIASAAMVVGGLCTLTDLRMQPADRHPRVPHIATGGVIQTQQRPASAQAPPGWYPDPADDARERYWTGVAWTENVRLSASHRA